MAGFNEVFQRVEKKFRLSPEQRRHVERALAPAMEPDAYGRSLITSLYLDTPERSLISRSTEKPLYKEKIRLRAYGSEAGGLMGIVADGRAYRASAEERERMGREVAFLEVKKKFKGVVYKRRVALTLLGAGAYLSGAGYEEAQAAFPLPDAGMRAAALSPRGVQIAREADALLRRHGGPDPSMLISCERVAWAPAPPSPEAETGLRVTFDDRLLYRDVAALDPGWHDVVAPGESVMEVKNAGPLPLWVVRALSEARAYSASFSKYGTAYGLAADRAAKREQPC